MDCGVGDAVADAPVVTAAAIASDVESCGGGGAPAASPVPPFAGEGLA